MKKERVVAKKEKTPAKTKPISVADFFGTACVAKVSKPVIAGKRKQVSTAQMVWQSLNHFPEMHEFNMQKDFEIIFLLKIKHLTN